MHCDRVLDKFTPERELICIGLCLEPMYSLISTHHHMSIVLSESTFCRWGLWYRISCLILASVICRKLCFGYAVPCWFSPGGVYLLVTSPRISSYSNIIRPRTLATCYTLPTSCAHSQLASFRYYLVFVFYNPFFPSAVVLVLVSKFACKIYWM